MLGAGVEESGERTYLPSTRVKLCLCCICTFLLAAPVPQCTTWLRDKGKLLPSRRLSMFSSGVMGKGGKYQKSETEVFSF